MSPRMGKPQPLQLRAEYEPGSPTHTLVNINPPEKTGRSLVTFPKRTSSLRRPSPTTTPHSPVASPTSASSPLTSRRRVSLGLLRRELSTVEESSETAHTNGNVVACPVSDEAILSQLSPKDSTSPPFVFGAVQERPPSALRNRASPSPTALSPRQISPSAIPRISSPPPVHSPLKNQKAVTVDTSPSAVPVFPPRKSSLSPLLATVYSPPVRSPSTRGTGKMTTTSPRPQTPPPRKVSVTEPDIPAPDLTPENYHDWISHELKDFREMLDKMPIYEKETEQLREQTVARQKDLERVEQDLSDLRAESAELLKTVEKWAKRTH